MSEQTHRSTFGSALAYKDPEAAIAWLEKAFGFDLSMAIRDDTGKMVHSEMSFGNGYIMVGDEWAENIKAPASVGGANTQRLSVGLQGGLDAHCERAREAGARIAMEPNNQPYGARVYVAVDPEGHVWDFEAPAEAAPDAMERAGYAVQQLAMPSDEQTAATFFPDAFYRDPYAAIDWLQRAFGFDLQLIIDNGDAQIRSHLGFGSGRVAVSSESSPADQPKRLSPLSVGGGNTQTIHIQLGHDIDAHCERARAAGAEIVQEPETQFYGDRTYRALDPEGHMWTLAQTITVMTPEQWDAASGLKTTLRG
jgi:uncharacterized glyoxalase superfamily protein PhnB